MEVKVLMFVGTIVISFAVPAFLATIQIDLPVDVCKNDTFNKPCEKSDNTMFCSPRCNDMGLCPMECLPVIDYLCNSYGSKDIFLDSNQTAEMVMKNGEPVPCSNRKKCNESEGYETHCRTLSNRNGFCCRQKIVANPSTK